MTDQQKSLIEKGNLKLSVFTSCSYDEIKKVCDCIVDLGYDCEFVDNGNIVFQKKEDIEEGDCDDDEEERDEDENEMSIL